MPWNLNSDGVQEWVDVPSTPKPYSGAIPYEQMYSYTDAQGNRGRWDMDADGLQQWQAAPPPPTANQYGKNYWFPSNESSGTGDSWVDTQGYRNAETGQFLQNPPKGANILQKAGNIRAEDYGLWGPAYKAPDGTIYGTTKGATGAAPLKPLTGGQFTPQVVQGLLEGTAEADRQHEAAGDGWFDEMMDSLGPGIALLPLGIAGLTGALGAGAASSVSAGLNATIGGASGLGMTAAEAAALGVSTGGGGGFLDGIINTVSKGTDSMFDSVFNTLKDLIPDFNPTGLDGWGDFNIPDLSGFDLGDLSSNWDLGFDLGSLPDFSDLDIGGSFLDSLIKGATDKVGSTAKETLLKTLMGGGGAGGTTKGLFSEQIGKILSGGIGTAAGIYDLMNKPSAEELTKMFDPFGATGARGDAATQLQGKIGELAAYDPNSKLAGLSGLMSPNAPQIQAAQAGRTTLGAAPTMQAATVGPAPTMQAANVGPAPLRNAAQVDPLAQNAMQYFEPARKMLMGETPITEDPAYKFNLEAGQKALDRTMASRGMSLSGNAVYEAMNYGQGMASNEWQKSVNNLMALGSSQAGTSIQEQAQQLTRSMTNAQLQDAANQGNQAAILALQQLGATFQQDAATRNQAIAAQFGLTGAGFQQEANKVNQGTQSQFAITQGGFDQATNLANAQFQQQANVGNVSNQMDQQRVNAQYQAGLAGQEQQNEWQKMITQLNTLLTTSGANVNPGGAAQSAYQLSEGSNNQALANIMGGVGQLSDTNNSTDAYKTLLSQLIKLG